MFIPLTEIKNQPAGGAPGVVYYLLPGGLRIHLAGMLLSLPAGKLVEDLVDRVQFRLGTNNQRDLQPKYWDNLLTLDGPQYGFQGNQAGSAACYIPWQFSEPTRETPVAKTNFALDLRAGEVAAIALKLNANVTHPTVTRGFILAEPLEGVRGPLNRSARDLPTLAKYKQTDINPGGTSSDLDTQIQALKSGRLISAQIYDPVTTGAVTEMSLKIDSADSWAAFKGDNDFLMRYFGLNPRAGIIDVVPDLLDDQSSAWNMSNANKLQLNIKSAAAMTGGVTVVTKTWEEME